MKISEQWLREWANPDIGSEALQHQITMAGLEVDGCEGVAGQFSGVVVAEVKTTEPHPDADKLRVCRVSDGDEEYQIVCGAPNVRPGLKVPLARIGALLPGNFKIKKAKLRGVESSGMLCSEQELGLSDAADGLYELPADAPVGEDIREYLKLNDVIIDVDLTPNRSDCLSILGVAREVAALNKLSYIEPEVPAVAFTHNQEFPVALEAPEGCPQYAGRVIKNVDLSRPTPLWMVEKLRRSGIRSIDPAVDVTNFVMLELGQPMHAFDLAELSGGIRVRWARADEKLLLLDGQEITLNASHLVIADEEKVLALAGIMGGEHSGVQDKTRDIFLESAFFTPLKLAGKAREFGLHTDSSHRFERGVDPANQIRAIERATRLLLDIVGGEPGPVFQISKKENLPARSDITLRHDRVDEILGLHLDRTRIEEMLARLGIRVVKVTREGWVMRPPSHRFDLSIEVDLIEEIARIYGYNRLPVTEPQAQLKIPALPEARTSLRQMRQHLVGLGYREAITYSFVDREALSQLTPSEPQIELANPIASDMAVMRTTLLAGLLKAVRYNQHRQQHRIRLFESGLSFRQVDDELQQEPMLAGVICGSRHPEGWHSTDKAGVDFFDLKGHVESLLGRVGIEASYAAADKPALQPGQSAVILRDGREIGLLGALHPGIAKKLDLNGSIYVFELRLNEIKESRIPSFAGVSKFPENRRDLAILIDKATPFSAVSSVIDEAAGPDCIRHTLFDVYAGEHIGEDKVSLAISVVWRNSERTMRDEEVSEAFNRVVTALQERLSAVLRS